MTEIQISQLLVLLEAMTPGTVNKLCDENLAHLLYWLSKSRENVKEEILNRTQKPIQQG